MDVVLGHQPPAPLVKTVNVVLRALLPSPGGTRSRRPPGGGTSAVARTSP
ncbi:hypothetical protein VA596_28095 [Amycolatopsis sp., V23-08]|uniref:Uncharacterized protein n=1 Tax=Amycolatopsis heterodermiae TaxID=3110235 RepID=A0ABU5RCR8_9PSEU|nr:hypothetical protein [Amycolatopsis sp., V23-08]MEA5363424.1 hypothetical protein [Amycolatopsis sp., V23-08]